MAAQSLEVIFAPLSMMILDRKPASHDSSILEIKLATSGAVISLLTGYYRADLVN